MKKIFILVFSSIIILSCGTRKNMNYKSSLGSLENIRNISYFSPVYSFKDDESAKSRSGGYFVKYTDHAADSIFKAESKKFHIRNKIVPRDHEQSLEVRRTLNSLFEQVLNEMSIEDIKISPVVNSVAKENSDQYAMAILISPEMKREYSGFKSVTYHLLIFDTMTEKISFYGSSSSRRSPGYVDRFIHNIEEIYGLKE